MKGLLKFRLYLISSCGLAILAMLIPLAAQGQSVPVVSSFSPSSGVVGSSVNIFGTNFSATTLSNIVYFGAVQAAVSSASMTNLTVTVPVGATFAPITVTVNGFVAYGVAPFEPTFTGSGAAIDASTFAPGVNLNSAGSGPIITVIADLDGDGKPDLVVANTYAHSISIHQNVGTNGVLNAATFAAPVVFPVGSGSDDPRGVTVADVDGDGKLDLLVPDDNTNQIVIYRNISSGGTLTTNSFAPPIFLTVAAGPQQVVVRDLDGDGHPDIISVNQGSGTISILRNLGTAGSITSNSFAPHVDLVSAGNAESLAVGDLDGDGKPDLAAADNSGFISLYRNNCTPGNISAGTFDTRADLPAQSGSLNVVIGDLDGDGRPELITTAYLPQIMSVYHNLSVPGSLTTNSFAASVDYALAGRGHTIALSDINGDGKPDIAEVTELSSALSLFQNIGTGNFTNTSLSARVDYATGWNAWGVAVGDLDGDGRPDVVFANSYDNTLTLYKNIIPFGTPSSCISAPSGLVGWWQGEGNANDSAGTNNGVLSASGATYASGKVGQAFRFDGTNGYVQIPDADSLKPTNVTVEAWVWLDPNVSPGTEVIVFKRNSWTFLFEGYNLAKEHVDNGDGTFTDRFSFVITSNGDQVITRSTTVVQRGVWYHVAGTYDGNKATIWVNGVAETSSIAGFALDYGTRPVFIGTTGEPAPYVDMLAGIIDEPSIYNRALSTNEIQAIYNAGSAGKCPPTCTPAPSELVAWWKAEGNVLDSVGTNNGSVTIGNITYTNGEVGQAFNFDGGANRITVPDAPQLDFGAGQDFSIDAWIRANPDARGFPGVEDIVEKRFVPPPFPNFSTGQGWELALSNGQLVGQLGDTTPAGPFIIFGAGPDLRDGVFHHVALTVIRNSTIGGKLYVDGQLVQTFDPTGQSGDLSNTQPLLIGNHPDPDVNGYFNGVIDEVSIYRRALAADEVQAIYNAGSQGKCMPLTSPPVIFSQPTNQVVLTNSTVVFAVIAGGSQPLNYQWYSNSVPLSDNGHFNSSSTSSLTISNVQPLDAAGYAVVITNSFGSITSSMASLIIVSVPTTITLQPQSQTAIAGTNIIFTAAAAGDAPLNYQWYFNGNPLTDDGRIIGSGSTNLSISNVQISDAGNYTLTVSNLARSMTSTTAVLTVLVPSAITTQPIGRSVPPGLPTTLTASASGTSLNLQWQLNGTNIPNATNTTYSIAAVGTNDIGFYHFVASNILNMAVSADAQLTFGPVAAWGRNLSNESLPPPGLSSVVAVAGSFGASFAVRTDGTIATWGGGTVTNIPANASNVVVIAASGTTADYALCSDGTVIGWNGIPAPALSNIVSIAAGNGFGYALRAEGTLTNWGIIPIPGFPAGLDHLTTIAAGYNNAVGLRNDGTVFVAGNGVMTNVPSGLNNVIAVAAGYTYAMALKSNGTVVAWGSGTGTNLPAGMTNIIAISAGNTFGENFGAAVRSNGKVVAWGDNSLGETSPPAALNNLVSIAAAAVAFHGLALVNDGSPVILHPPIGLTAFVGRDVTLHGDAAGAQTLSYQWLFNGTNLPGATNTSLVISNIQLANAGNYQLLVSNSVNTALSLPAPLTVISNNTLTFLSQPVAQTNYQGGTATLGVAVLGNGPLRYQWSFSTNNQIFTSVSGATNDSLVFDPALAIQSGFYRVAVSNQFNLVTSSSAFLRVLFAKSWGFFPTDPPFNVTNAIAIAVGNAGTGTALGHYLALKSDGKIASWSGGFSSFGETNVTALSNSIVTAIAAGFEDSLALKSDGTVYAWGDNNFGETNVPSGLNSVIAIACGDNHDLALKLDNTITGWGQNTFQQTTNAAATNAVAIAAGGQDSMALRADGSVVTWGSFGGGQFPVPFNATNIIAIAAGGQHFLALRANGTVVSWGNNSFGQTTIPAGLSNVVAISAGANHSVFLRNDGTVVTLGAFGGSTLITAPSDLANVIAIASSGDHDLALFGTRAPAFTIQPFSRTIFNTTTSVLFAAKCAGVQPVHYQWQLNGTNLPAATNDTLTVTNQSPSPGKPPVPIPLQSGIYQLIASNAYGVVASKFAKLTVLIPLGVAVDATNLNWTSSGNAQWFGETNVTHDGVDAAQSGGIGALQETILQTTFGTNWSGRYTFWWKVSSEQDFDFLEFRVNGIVQTNISGEVNWQQVSIPVAAGTNVLQWRYSKDASFDDGLDAGWLDQFAYIADPPVITLQPASQIVNMGTNVTFRVTAIGNTPDLRYQWRQNGNLVGGNSPVLVLGNVGRAQNGNYFVTVTNSNSSGSTVSSNAVLKVLVPQLLGSPALSPDGTLTFTSTDANGGLLSPSDLANFQAQASTDLVNWVTLTNAFSLTNGMLQLQDNGGTNWPARFYRIVEH
jgi:alpha-tubulin suppressor-like RCC1 family protein